MQERGVLIAENEHTPFSPPTASELSVAITLL